MFILFPSNSILEYDYIIRFLGLYTVTWDKLVFYCDMIGCAIVIHSFILNEGTLFKLLCYVEVVYTFDNSPRNERLYG